MKKNGNKRQLLLILAALAVLVLYLVIKPSGSSAPSPAETSSAETLSLAETSSAGETAPGPEEEKSEENVPEETAAEEETVTEDGTYLSKDEVAAYIYKFGHLPSNYVTKKEAEKAGWVASEGNLWEVLPGCAIGGNRFGNYEGLLPEGRDYTECDVNYDGGRRGPERIVFSDDGLIFYTADHYETFEELYPKAE